MKLGRIFSRQSASADPAIPRGQRVYAIGDIHGRRDLLDLLLGRIARDDAARGAAATTIVLLGDLVDRGPDSKGVIDRILALRDEGRVAVRCLLGNHDELFLKAVSGDGKSLRFLCRNGGEETLASYGLDLGDHDDSGWGEIATRLRDHVPEAHLVFLDACEDRAEIGGYLFVHAGIRPGVAIEEQSSEDLRWIRTLFLESKSAHPRMIVHGHSISRRVEMLPNRIGLDTGAFATGRLTAMGFEGTDRWILEAAGAPDPRWLNPRD